MTFTVIDNKTGKKPNFEEYKCDYIDVVELGCF